MRQYNCPILLTVGIGLLLGTRAASAGAIGLTGNVEVDFPIVPGNGVVAVIDNPVNGAPSAGDVSQHPSLSGITGWNIKDLRLAYDDTSDTMYFGVNTFGIAGDADGDGNPGALSAGFGQDLPSLGGTEAIVVALDFDHDGKGDVIAGVPSVKPNTGKGIDHFTVARYKHSEAGLPFSFGETLTGHLGDLPFDPSAERPDFEFSIANFKQLPGLIPADGFRVRVFSGNEPDRVAGEDELPWTTIGFPGNDRQNVPEPSTVLAWALVAGGAIAYRVRRRQTSAR